MSVLYTKLFWVDAGERAVKTFAQGLLGVMGSGALGVLDVDWRTALSVAVLASMSSILFSVASAGTGSNSASVVVDNVKRK